MNKEDNPFFSIVEIMRREGAAENPTPFFIGTIANTTPLTIRAGDTEIERKNMKVNASLTKGLQKGEEVLLLMSRDQQQYILVCKLE